jgi:hypothetical protein
VSLLCLSCVSVSVHLCLSLWPYLCALRLRVVDRQRCRRLTTAPTRAHAVPTGLCSLDSDGVVHLSRVHTCRR